jgi:hypothetical protein
VLLDIFDKRFAVYEELQACLSRARVDRDQMAVVAFKTAALHAQFLFGATVTYFLHETASDLAVGSVQ